MKEFRMYVIFLVLILGVLGAAALLLKIFIAG